LRVEVTTADGKREHFTARHVISSAPVRELTQKLTPKPISLLHARALRYRDFITVALMTNRADVFAVARDGARMHELPWPRIFLL